MQLGRTFVFLLLATAVAVIRHTELRTHLQQNKCGPRTCLSYKPTCCKASGNRHECVKDDCQPGWLPSASGNYKPPVKKKWSFPTSAAQGESWMQTACRAAIVQGMGAAENQHVTIAQMNEITHIQFKPGHSAFTTHYWHQDGPKPESCTLYPSETSTTYADRSTRETNKCDLYNMRHHLLCPTDNPVKPLAETKNIVFEARHDKDLKSKFLCPTSGPGEWASALELLRGLKVQTYGGEAECKQMVMKVSSREGATGSNPDPAETYGKTFLSINRDDEELARLETEWWQGQTKGSKVYFEFVSGVFPLTEGSHTLYTSIVDGIASMTSTSTLQEIQTTLQSRLPHDLTVNVYDQAPFTKELTSIETPAKIKSSSCVCQGNYAIPASQVGLGFNDHPKWKKAFELGELLVTTLEGRHASITLSDADKSEMRTMFAIYFYNMYFFREFDTLKDNKKDSWDQLPKAAPLDIMRSLSDEAKSLMLAEFATA